MAKSTYAIQKTLEKTLDEKGKVSLIGCVMVVIGVLLCLTVIGAIIGIPLIWQGIFGARAEMNKPNTLWEAPCPTCGTLLHVPTNLLGSNCPACAKRFLIRGNSFEAVD